MCLPECKECRRKAFKRREYLVNAMLLVAFTTGMAALWAISYLPESWLGWWGVLFAFLLLFFAHEAERS